MKSYTITPVPRVTFIGMGAVYMSTFGALWLFLEPLGAFGLFPTVSKLSGFFIYSLLLITPAFLLPAFLRWHRWYKTHNLPFISVKIRSAADGVTYSLRVAENMQISDFLSQYTEILLRGPARNNVQATLHRYYPVLQISRSGVMVDVDSNLTLHTAGLRDGEECQVRAKEYDHKNEVLFSLRSQNDA